MSAAMRLLHTVRHLGAHQLATRVLRVIERGWWRVTNASAPAAPAVTHRASEPLWRDLDADARTIDRARDLIAGRFTFLAETRVHPSWSAADASRLWRFHLHYFDYVKDLAALASSGERVATYETFRALTESWMAASGRLGGDAWHPYTISLRIVNWCEADLVFAQELARDAEFAGRLRESIAAQAEFLSRHLETDVRGNHLLENVRALLRASASFEGAASDRWRRIAAAILEREIPEQILSDGGHFERAPGYHLRVLEVLEDVGRMHPIPVVTSAVARMRAYLDAVVPRNGRLPLLKDTTLPERAWRIASPQPSRWLAASGHAVLRDDAYGDHLIADFGRVCPDYLPAHAHADMFSYELTIGDRPVVVDSGVFEYAAGEWRNWFRSTRAHNTVTVDGADQSEMWGSFRVGRRARVREVTWRETDDATIIDGTHDGYAPAMHRRVILALRGRRAWVVLDRVSNARGRIVESFLHLHPDRPQLPFRTLGTAVWSEESGWYSERFGEKRPNRVIRWTLDPAEWSGYVIAAEILPAVAWNGAQLELDGRVIWAAEESATARPARRD